MTLHVAIKIAYFNTKDFAHGFQVQPDIETIFGYIQKALIKAKFIDKHDNSLTYAGRTDHGVNATSQVIALVLKNDLQVPDRILFRINKFLPLNIRCWSYAIVSEDFHPRFDALERSYYYVYTKDSSEVLNIILMQEASKLLIGKHNFVNFAKRDTPDDKYTRDLRELTIKESEDVIIFYLSAKSFLWQQCRRIVAHLIQIGKRELLINDTKKLLSMTENVVKPTPSPPENLILSDIKYANVHFIEEEPIKLKINQLILAEIYQGRKKENSLTFFLNLLENL